MHVTIILHYAVGKLIVRGHARCCVSDSCVDSAGTREEFRLFELSNKWTGYVNKQATRPSVTVCLFVCAPSVTVD